MKYVFDVVEIPERIWSKVKIGIPFKMNLPKDSIAYGTCQGNGSFMWIYYPESENNEKEKVSFFLIPNNEWNNKKRTIEVPGGMEIYEIGNHSCQMVSCTLFGLKKKS